MAPIVLRTVVFMGSARDMPAHWGGDARLGSRVLRWVTRTLEDRTAPCGPDTVSHELKVLDPVDSFAADGPLADSGAQLRRPHFFYKPGGAPPAMERVRELIRSADCYVVVTPEYNHSVPPALASLLGHFGGSNYACKPSAIVTYSPGPFAGMRAAVALRPLLSELGCLPVSKLTGVPTVDAIFNEDGTPRDETHRMLRQLPAMLSQLEWMAVAMRRQRDVAGVPA